MEDVIIHCRLTAPGFLGCYSQPRLLSVQRVKDLPGNTIRKLERFSLLFKMYCRLTYISNKSSPSGPQGGDNATASVSWK